jgi:hypothetical protein
MASIIYLSFLDDLARGLIDCDGDSFKVMLLTSGYAPDKTGHTKRSHLTNEVVGANYAAGGTDAAVTVTKDAANSRVEIGLGQATWPGATITARYAAYYKAHGGAAAADELVALVDFGADYISTGGPFALAASALRLTD